MSVKLNKLNTLPLNSEGLPCDGITIVYDELKTPRDEHNRSFSLPGNAIGWIGTPTERVYATGVVNMYKPFVYDPSGDGVTVKEDTDNGGYLSWLK